MKVNLKLYASLGQYLPDHAVKNEAVIETDNELSVEAILAMHDVPPENCHLVLVNGLYTTPSERAGKMLEDGDSVAVWPPVAGG